MAGYDGSIRFDTRIDSSGLKRDADGVKTTVSDLFRSLRDIMQGPVAALNMVKDAIKGIGGATVGQASKIEDMEAAFTPLVGGADNAKAMIAALNKEAATTPYELEGIGSVAKQLLPVLGNNVEAVTSTFRMLGDTAGGNIEKLDTITRGYMKTMLKGHADMESLNMIAEAGVPIYTELAKSMGISVHELTNMSAAGTITADDLSKAFKSMTSQGGIFYDGMKVASKTLSGETSTMTDNMKQAGAAIGTAFLPLAKAAVETASKAAESFTKWATEGNNLTTALKMLAAVGVSVAIAGIVQAAPGFVAGISAMKTAVMAFNTTALFGPTGIIIGLGLLVAALVGVGNAMHQSELDEINKQFGDLTKEAGMSAEKVSRVQEALANSSKGEGTFEEAADQVKQFSQDLGISEEQVIKVGLASKEVTDEYKKTLRAVQDYNSALKESNKYIIGTKEWVAAQKASGAATKKTTEAVKDSAQWNDKLRESEIARLEAERDAAEQLAKEQGQDAKTIYYIKKEINDKIVALQIQGLEAERDAELANVEDTKANEAIRYQIRQVYADKILALEINNATERAKTEADSAKSISIWQKTLNTVYSTLQSSISGFKRLGAAIVDGGAGWKDFRDLALSALADVLQALGAELAAMAAAEAMQHHYASALLGAAAAAAAYTASGIVGAMVNTSNAAEEAAIKTAELSEALKEVLRSGKVSGTSENFLGYKQESDYLSKIQLAADAAAKALKKANDVYWNPKFKKASDEANDYVKTLQYVYDTVYKGNTVTADTSSIYEEWAKNLEDTATQYGVNSEEVAILNDYYQGLIDDAINPVASALKESNKSIAANIELFKDASKSSSAYASELSKLKETEASLYESFANIGDDLASTLVDSLSDGLDEADFMDAVEKYITKLVIQAAVFTDTMTARIAAIGQEIAAAIASGVDGNSTEIIDSLEKEMSDIYNSIKQTTDIATSVINGVFGGSTDSSYSGTHVVGYASGTDNATEGWHWTGENGPELAYFQAGGKVINAQRSAELLAGSTAGAASMRQAINLVARGNVIMQLNEREIGRAMFEMIDKEARSGYGY